MRIHHSLIYIQQTSRKTPNNASVAIEAFIGKIHVPETDEGTIDFSSFPLTEGVHEFRYHLAGSSAPMCISAPFLTVNPTAQIGLPRSVLPCGGPMEINVSWARVHARFWVYFHVVSRAFVSILRSCKQSFCVYFDSVIGSFMCILTLQMEVLCLFFCWKKIPWPLEYMYCLLCINYVILPTLAADLYIRAAYIHAWLLHTCCLHTHMNLYIRATYIHTRTYTYVLPIGIHTSTYITPPLLIYTYLYIPAHT